MRWMGYATTALLLVALGACAGAPLTPGPQGDEAGSATRGFAFASEVCAECHAIAAGDYVSPYPMAPPFQRVVETPGLTRLAFGAWMRTSHPSMPDFVVTDAQIDDLHAYLSSLSPRSR